MKPAFILLILALVAGTFASPYCYNNQYFHVSSPIGARTWDTGSTQEVTWWSNELHGNVDVYLYRHEPSGYVYVSTIRKGVSIGTGVATYNVPKYPTGSNFYIKITGYQICVFVGPITIKKVGGEEAGDEHENENDHQPTLYDHEDEHNDDHEPTNTEYEHNEYNDDHESTPTPTPTEYEEYEHNDHDEPTPTEYEEYEHNDHDEPTPTEYEEYVHNDHDEPTPTEYEEYEHNDHYEPTPTPTHAEHEANSRDEYTFSSWNPLHVTAPQNGAKWKVGSWQAITWWLDSQYTQYVDEKVDVILYKVDQWGNNPSKVKVIEHDKRVGFDGYINYQVPTYATGYYVIHIVSYKYSLTAITGIFYIFS